MSTPLLLLLLLPGLLADADISGSYDIFNGDTVEGVIGELKQQLTLREDALDDLESKLSEVHGEDATRGRKAEDRVFLGDSHRSLQILFQREQELCAKLRALRLQVVKLLEDLPSLEGGLELEQREVTEAQAELGTSEELAGVAEALVSLLLLQVQGRTAKFNRYQLEYFYNK